MSHRRETRKRIFSAHISTKHKQLHSCVCIQFKSSQVNSKLKNERRKIGYFLLTNTRSTPAIKTMETISHIRRTDRAFEHPIVYIRRACVCVLVYVCDCVFAFEWKQINEIAKKTTFWVCSRNSIHLLNWNFWIGFKRHISNQHTNNEKSKFKFGFCWYYMCECGWFADDYFGPKTRKSNVFNFVVFSSVLRNDAIYKQRSAIWNMGVVLVPLILLSSHFVCHNCVYSRHEMCAYAAYASTCLRTYQAADVWIWLLHAGTVAKLKTFPKNGVWSPLASHGSLNDSLHLIFRCEPRTQTCCRLSRKILYF